MRVPVGGEASVLVCFWSPKGGSGTTVTAVAAALVAAREAPVRLADLAGDVPAVLGLANDPGPGLTEWMRLTPDASIDALGRLAVEVAPRLLLLPTGAAGSDVPSAAGAELGAALTRADGLTVCDAGRLDGAVPAVLDAADASVAVVRGCYLALRRAVHHPALRNATGAVLVDEPGRSLGSRDVADVLGVPVLAVVEARPATARAVDAGVLASRMPETLARPLRGALARLGALDREQAA